MSTTTSHVSRCLGSLLGCACGDILGAAVEGYPTALIELRYGEVRDFLDGPRGLGCYTDDTQMTLALAESLVAEGALDAGKVAAAYARAYEPHRGYGAGAHEVLKALNNGADYRTTGRMQFLDGSYGNGGAMRIAPLGLAYRHAPVPVLRRVTEDALLTTHVHPEAIDGAFVQAAAVAWCARIESHAFDPQQLLQHLIELSEHSAVKERLVYLLEAHEQGHPDPLVIERVGNGIRTAEAVAAALWALVSYHQDPEQGVIRAVGFGGDTDTIGAMAGALLGALWGHSWVPDRWLGAMENKAKGRDHLIAVAEALAALDLS